MIHRAPFGSMERFIQSTSDLKSRVGWNQKE